MKGATIAVIACMFLGMQAVFQKKLLVMMSPTAIAGFTSFSAVIILFFILEVEHKAWELKKVTKKQWVWLLTLGVLSGLIAQLFFVIGLNNSTATNAVLLTRMNSLLIALGGVVFLKEKITKVQIMGALLMVLGVIVIATKRFTVQIRPESGDFLLILAACSWAAANIIAKRHLSQLHPEMLVFGRHLPAAIILTLLSLGNLPDFTNPSLVMNLGLLVIVVVLVAQYLWYWALEHTRASVVGITALTIPFFGVFYAVTLLGETLYDYQLWGGVLVVLGLVVIEMHLINLHDIGRRVRTHMPHH